MVKIYGNVKPEDDNTHPLGPERNSNESVYFNLLPRIQRVEPDVLDGGRVGYDLSEYLDRPED